jgi:hypothetical protein
MTLKCVTVRWQKDSLNELFSLLALANQKNTCLMPVFQNMVRRQSLLTRLFLTLLSAKY